MPRIAGIRRQLIALAIGAAIGMAALIAAPPGFAQVARGGPPPVRGSGGGDTPGMPNLPTPPIAPGSNDTIPGGQGPGDQGPGDQRQPAGLAPHAPDLICVTFGAGTPDDGSAAFAKSYGLAIVGRFEFSGLHLRMFLMRLPAGADFADTLSKTTADKRALSVQPDFIFVSLQSGAVPGNRQYALHRIRADEMPVGARGQGVTVALIDSGVDTRHESLKADDIVAIDVIQDGAAPPPETHGTALASIIAGSGKIRGLAPGVHLLALRAFKEADPATGQSASDTFHLAKAISLALDRRARIINLSIGGPNDPLVRLAVEQAVLTGTLVIAAAGNAGPDGPPVYPAAQRGVVAVTATDDRDRIYSGANRGGYIAIAAPGVDILAAKPGGAYDYFTGTSMATGYATGLAAVLLSADPRLTSTEVLKLLATSATDLGPPNRDPEFGWGRIDAEAAYVKTPQAGAAN